MFLAPGALFVYKLCAIPYEELDKMCEKQGIP